MKQYLAKICFIVFALIFITTTLNALRVNERNSWINDSKKNTKFVKQTRESSLKVTPTNLAQRNK